ncbi:16S rRNA (uracil(1498)-N(3))-methyltransferase [Limosilactobacillus mucosae]|uniref:16S rRNA (uracil(1498)-N(3))-methyltransferase n=1 Tax=Limosilactobacillus mucosae TaxID=97478 RepID=UPI00233F62C7|nr:16S rRNA (uracil(1498)-N(3))-methyltransferase [Limosilactobacillus mucosae]MDC2840816.1 16S rRNA (uracil(1498)-N(3))-methyltransferase [Limosilactobacillus mucosae]MDD6454808.1 16S rRNA (uracil(1498)-N(3))-methyltransferase [Lactobacillus sp.]MDD6893233.1 16S rRNA (uracil(1498)-N(3))-methyltransferase [Lactobacillus sp.]
MQRYFIDESLPKDRRLTLPADIAHHLIDVLRADVDTEIEVALNDQKVYLAKVVELNPATIELKADLGTDAELPVEVILACGLPKTKEKPELIVQKATEMGADRIVFFAAQRSISRWNPQKQAKKIERLQKIANAAAEQSHRNHQPEVVYGGKLSDVLKNEAADFKIVAWEESAKQGEEANLAKTLRQLRPGQKLLAIFGPEGGLSEAEIEQMQAQGVVPAGLGPRILRTETAPLYLLAAVSYQLELAR